MTLQNISNPTVLMNEFSQWLNRENDLLTTASDLLTEILVSGSLPLDIGTKFHTAFPNGLTFQVADIDSFEISSDGFSVVWVDGQGELLGYLAEPITTDPEAEHIAYHIYDKAYSINGSEYDAYTLIPYLIDNVATNNCVSTAIQLVKNGQAASLSDLSLMLPSFGARITDTALTYLGYIANYTENFSSPTGILGFIRDTYLAANSAQVDSETGKIVFTGNTRFVLKSAFTLAWSTVLGTAVQIVGSIAIASANAILGAIATGAGFIINAVSSLLANKTEGKVNTGVLNRAYDATFMSRPNYVLTSGSYCYQHLSDYGLITYSTPGALIHFAKNGTQHPTYSMAAVPELDVVLPFKYDDTAGTHVRQQGVPENYNIARTGSTVPFTYTVTWSDVSNSIMQFTECYGESPVTPNDALLKAASGIAYFIYNIFGILATNSFTLSGNWWSTFKSSVSLSDLKTANYIQTVQYMNTIASVLAVIASGTVTTVRRTSIGQDVDQWKYSPNDTGTYDLDSLLSWQMISDIILYIQVATDKYDVYHGLDQTLSTFQTNNKILCMDNYINLPFYYKVFYFDPPVTTSSSVAGLIATVVVAAAVIIAGTVIARKAIQNVVIPRMNKKYDEINTRRAEMQTSEYLDSHSNDEQMQDQVALLKTTRKYNFFAKVLGLSTISYTTGWENGDGRSAIFNSMSVDSEGSSLLESIPDIVQPESDTTCDNSTIDNSILYKIITGSNTI